MPKKNLTDLFVERVKPPASGRAEYFDAVFGGLALRVTESGHKSWSLFYRAGGKQRRYTLGSYPEIKPAQARRNASEALERVCRGVDLTKEKQALRNVRSAAPDTFADVVRDYLNRHGEKNLAPRTHRETRRLLLQSPDFAHWHDRPITEIARRDVIDTLDRIATRAPVQANRALMKVRAVCGWAVQKERIPVSPADGIKPPSRETSRDRALTNNELRWLWAACEEIGRPYGPLIKLLMLTAQRRSEVAAMRWSEIDLDKRAWTIPREKAKNQRAHIVHLSESALAVLLSIPRENDGLVFASSNGTPVMGFTHARSRLDPAMLNRREKELDGREVNPIPNWTLHDLRRTAATGMARLNFPPHVVDKVLNHVSGTIRGVAAVYNRFEYLDERRAALEAWGGFVSALLEGVRHDNLV